MKVKSISSVLLLLVAVVLAATSTTLNSPVSAVSKMAKTAETNHAAEAKSPDGAAEATPVGGENNPLLIPDNVAYMIVFRLLSSHKNEPERRRLHGYVRQNLGITDDKEIEAVFRLADDFKRRVIPVDDQINSIKERYHPSHMPFSRDDRKELEKLKKNKEKIVGELLADIPRRLSANGKDKLHKNIQERVKKKIKPQDHPAN